jgi:DNA repair exonuclease SbcCD ATPase subunit
LHAKGINKMSDSQKLSGKQLVETIKDTIYEVLEEELDARLAQAEKNKQNKTNEAKAKRVSEVKKLKEAKAKLEKVQKAKQALKEKYDALNKVEKELQAVGSEKPNKSDEK